MLDQRSSSWMIGFVPAVRVSAEGQCCPSAVMALCRTLGAEWRTEGSQPPADAAKLCVVPGWMYRLADAPARGRPL